MCTCVLVFSGFLFFDHFQFFTVEQKNAKKTGVLKGSLLLLNCNRDFISTSFIFERLLFVASMILLIQDEPASQTSDVNDHPIVGEKSHRTSLRLGLVLVQSVDPGQDVLMG